MGLHVDRLRKMTEIGYKEAFYKIPEKEFPSRPHLPTVTLLGTGGTIASRLDYRTGAVIPAFTPGELYGAVPELADLANLTTKKLFGVFSENMAKEQYVALAEAIGREIEAGVDGIVIGHGTDTMGHTAGDPVLHGPGHAGADRHGGLATLERPALERRGAQPDPRGARGGPRRDRRGPDLHVRSDLGRVRAAAPGHALPQDAQLLPLDVPHDRGHPLAMVGEEFTYLSDDFRRRDRSRQVKVDTAYEDRMTILYYYPGMKPDLVDALVEKGYRGIVIAGTGLGHVNKPLYPALKRAVVAGVHVVMTVQTLWGYAQMYVYDTGATSWTSGSCPSTTCFRRRR